MNRAKPSSIWDRTISRPRPLWATVVVVALIYLPSLAAGVALGLTDFTSEPASRALLAPPTVIAYVFILGPILGPLEVAVVRSLRPILQAEAEEVDRIVRRAETVTPWQELAAIGAGLALGVLVIGFPAAPARSWPNLVIVASAYAMLGLLGWTGFVSIAGTRVLNAVLRLPMQVDPLDRKPFEPIGRWSLAIALAFVGGILIGLILGSYGPAALLEPRFWLLFLPLSLLPVVIFYLNMGPTHRVLAAARDGALAEVQNELRRSFPMLLARMRRGEATGNLPWEINALVAYEKELDQVSTWPYNPVILRTLFVSVLIPAATLLTRRIAEVYIR
ncbi:MAG TPA: hypothetical protein VK449_06075 [Anaerolineales bacterium]|nr:hypothetical protein [Anaerolineales bacterium]